MAPQSSPLRFDSLVSSIVSEYLANLPSEKALYAPFQAMLRTQGFFDIHLTHGHNEKGKDFIAKRVEDGTTIQWSFQLKKGDIARGEWLSELQHQMALCAGTGLEHPNYDDKAPQTSVFVTSGKIAEHVNGEIESFGRTAKTRYRLHDFEVWPQSVLVDKFSDDETSALRAIGTDDRLLSRGFYARLGHAIAGELTLHEVEEYSRAWLEPNNDGALSIERSVLESAFLAGQVRLYSGLYEAFYIELLSLRTICDFTVNATDSKLIDEYKELFEIQRVRVGEAAREFLADARRRIDEAGGDVLGSIKSPATIVEYPVLCARVAEVAAMLIITEDDVPAVSDLEMMLAEPGFVHPVSDKYAVSIVWSLIAACSKDIDNRESLIKSLAQYLFERYESGFGIANVDASVRDEVFTLVGYPFEYLHVQKFKNSFVATALLDLCAFFEYRDLFAYIWAKLQDIEVSCTYWIPADSNMQCCLNASDVVEMPSIVFALELSTPHSKEYSPHIQNEPEDYLLNQRLGQSAMVYLSLTLRDRYFPKIWGGIATC